MISITEDNNNNNNNNNKKESLKRKFSTDSKVLSTTKKYVGTKPWNNIAAASKLLISYQPNPKELDSERIIIKNAEPSFFSNFLYEKNDIIDEKLTFERLVGRGTSIDAVLELKKSIIKNTTKSISINLYRKDETPLSCHITSLTLHGDNQNLEKTKKSLENMHNNIVNTKKLEILSILTIRSAAIVGNCKAIGIGVMGDGQTFENTEKSAKQNVKDYLLKGKK